MSIGEALAEARQQAGLSVEQVSERTYIRQLIIRSIEGDDYSVCGGDFYARGYIRSIAKVVGADAGPLIDEYDADHREPGPVSATGIGELTALGAASERRRLNWALLAGLAVVIALGLAGYLLLFSPGQAGKSAAPAASAQPAARSASPSASPQPTPSPTAPAVPPAQPLAPVSATAVGAGGRPGDNPELAHLATDGSPATAWHSDWYATARLGGLAPGTGLLLDMGRPVTITAARVRLGGSPGASLQLRIGSSHDPAALRPVAHASGAGSVAQLPVASRAQGRYVLLWFTRLPPDATGTFQASVRDISLRGQR